MELGARSEVRLPPSKRISGSLLRLAIAGGVAFWLTTFVSSLLPLAAELRAATQISWLPMVLVESPIGGLVVGCCVSYLLLRFGGAAGSREPVVASVTLAGLALVAASVVRGLVWLVGSSHDWQWFFIGGVLDLPRFLALGVVIGYVYKRQAGSGSGEHAAANVSGG